MAKKGFVRNPKTVAQILATHDGGKRAAVEQAMSALPSEVKDRASITVYQTDREVVGLVVPADDQARDGVGTRAAGEAGLLPR